MTTTLTYDERAWRLVPVTPTDTMLNAAHSIPRCPAKDGTDCGYNDVWRAMLSAAPQPEPVETDSAASGWAICNATGEIDLRTVSPTERAAIVNWLFAADNRFISRGMNDEQIIRLWDDASAARGVRLVRVSVSEHSAIAAAVRAENEACAACVEQVAGLRFKQGELSENGQAVLNYIIPHIAQSIRARQEGK